MNLQALASPEGVTAMNQALLRQQVGVATMRKALDSQELIGQQLVQMMQSSGIGNNINTVA